MNIYKLNVHYKYIFRNNFKTISTFVSAKNDLAFMKTLTPKQLGKIAIDVSKCANSDIKVWDTFVKNSYNSINSFDYKDTLRILKGLNTFYQFLNYEIRKQDLSFLGNILERLFECCDSYNCTELSEVAEVISTFVVANGSVIDPCKLFSKISVLFKIRLAECLPSDAVRMAVSFSKVGISDKPLLETLVNFALSNKDFTVEELRTLSASFVILEYYDKNLLYNLCEKYARAEGLSTNELAILSFIFSKSSYSNDIVLKIFERNLNEDLNFIDIPSFCINLHKIGVPIPEKFINSLTLEALEVDLFIEILDLFSSFPSKQDEILKRCKGIKRTMDQNIKILEFVSKAPFTEKTKELFKLVMLDKFNYLKDSRYPPIIATLPVNWLLEGCFQTIDINLINKENINQFTIIQCSMVSFLKFCRNKGDNTSLDDGHLLNDIEDNLNKIEKDLKVSTPDLLLDILPNETNTNVPYLLINQIEKLLNRKIEVSTIQNKFKVLVIKGTRTVILPTSTDDFLIVEGEQIDCRWIPPGTVPCLDLLSKMYIISNHGYQIKPISHYEWNKLSSDKLKLNYLTELFQ